MDDSEMICVCGDSSAMHIDGCEQCFNGDCGCKEFEEDLPEESKQMRDSIEQIHKNYPNLHHGPGSNCPIEFCAKCDEISKGIN